MLYETETIKTEIKNLKKQFMKIANEQDTKGNKLNALEFRGACIGLEDALKVIDKLEDNEIENQFKTYLINEAKMESEDFNT